MVKWFVAAHKNTSLLLLIKKKYIFLNLTTKRTVLGIKKKTQFEECICVPAGANRVIIKSLIVSAAAAAGGSGKLNTGTSTIVLYGSRWRRVSFHCQPLVLFALVFFTPQFPSIQRGRRAADAGVQHCAGDFGVTQGERLTNRLAHCLFPTVRGECGVGRLLFTPPLLAVPASEGPCLTSGQQLIKPGR